VRLAPGSRTIHAANLRPGRPPSECSGAVAAKKKITVKAPNDFSVGGVVTNASRGTAKLKVKLPYAGTARLSGKGVRGAKRKVGKALTVTLAVTPTGALARKLAGRRQRQGEGQRQVQPQGRQGADQVEDGQADPSLSQGGRDSRPPRETLRCRSGALRAPARAGRRCCRSRSRPGWAIRGSAVAGRRR
jgi:hypothetical protein